MVSGISTFGGIRQQEKYQQLIHDIKSPIYGPRGATNCTLIRTCDQRRINIVNSGLVNAFNGNHSTSQPLNHNNSSSGSMFFLQQQPQPQQQQQQQQQFIQHNNNNQYQQQQQYESVASTQQLRQLFC